MPTLHAFIFRNSGRCHLWAAAARPSPVRLSQWKIFAGPVLARTRPALRPSGGVAASTAGRASAPCEELPRRPRPGLHWQKRKPHGNLRVAPGSTPTSSATRPDGANRRRAEPPLSKFNSRDALGSRGVRVASAWRRPGHRRQRDRFLTEAVSETSQRYDWRYAKRNASGSASTPHARHAQVRRMLADTVGQVPDLSWRQPNRTKAAMPAAAAEAGGRDPRTPRINTPTGASLRAASRPPRSRKRTAPHSAAHPSRAPRAADATGSSR